MSDEAFVGRQSLGDVWRVSTWSARAISGASDDRESVMKLDSFEAIVRAQRRRCALSRSWRLAMNAHGYLRFTKDVDFVVQLNPDNIMRAFAAFRSLDYRPLVPITAQQFANAPLRESWIRDKGMQVLQFWSDEHRETPIDVFITEPFSFEDEYQEALEKPLYGSIAVRFVSIPTLIRMKEAANRPQDLIEIDRLRMRLEDMAKARAPSDEIDWSLTTWEGARREQLRRWAALPLERVIWASKRLGNWRMEGFTHRKTSASTINKGSLCSTTISSAH